MKLPDWYYLSCAADVIGQTEGRPCNVVFQCDAKHQSKFEGLEQKAFSVCIRLQKRARYSI